MAAKSSKAFAWQTNYDNRYLHLDGKFLSQEGILEFTEEDPKYVFQVEDASGYVKIKCTENNKYLTEVGGLIVAAETDDESSTLFEITKVESTNNTQEVVRVRHVKTNLYLRPQTVDVRDANLCAVEPSPDGSVYLFTFISPTP